MDFSTFASLKGRRGVLLALLLALPAAHAQAAAPRPAASRAASRPAARPFDVAPPAAWVQPLPLPSEPGGPDGARGATQKGSAGLRFRLVDLQSRVGPQGPEHYVHFARAFTSEGGVAEGSQLHFDFDPAYQHLTLHGVWRWRGGKRQAVLNPAEVKVIQQERRLEAQMYDGSLTALLFLRDVRVGDTVEYAYSVRGGNPAFRGHFATFVDAGYDEPVGLWRFRLLYPEGRPLFIKAHGTALAPQLASVNGEREYVWTQERLEALSTDDALPSWFRPYPELQLSDFATWEDVARWALPLFTPAPGKKGEDAGLAAEVARLQQAHATPEARLLAALRFAQDEVRYVGLEGGLNSHQPHAPAEVLARRFGDCKDKALLLVTLLRRLGIDAAPALVNTRAKQALDELLPSQLAFDHAIVRAQLAGHVYWLDATRTHERGALAQRQPPDLRRALVVQEGTRALEVIPAPEAKEPTIHVEEHYVARDRSGPATLTVTTRYSGPEADAKREDLSTADTAEMERAYLNYYARTDPDIQSVKPLEVKDDPEANVVTVTERYRIEGFWRDGVHEFDAELIGQQLARPDIARRTMPYAVRHPRHVSTSIRLDAPERLNVETERATLKGPASQMSYHLRANGEQLLLDYSYRSTADAVTPAQLAAHVKLVQKAREFTGYRTTLSAGNATPDAEIRHDLDATALGVLFGVLLFTLLGLWVLHEGPVNLWRRFRSRRRRGQFAAKFNEKAGSSPAAAFPLASVQELPAALARLRCSCGVRGGPHPSSAEPVFLGEQVILSLKWPCTGCGSERRAFYALPDEKQAA